MPFGAVGKSVTVGITNWPMCQRKNCNSSSHVFILVFLSGSALSYPSAIMRLLAPLFASALLAALALASTAAPQVRIGKWDSGKVFSRGEGGFSRALHLSALFSFTRHEAISGLLQGRILWRRTRAGQRKREISFSVVAATLFERSTCRPCSQCIWSVAAALFPLLAVRIPSPPSFSSLVSQNHAEEGCDFESGSDERARQKHASRAEEKRHSKGFFSEETHLKPPEEETGEARRGRGRRFETFEHCKELN